MQKKLIVCPISSHDPVSVTFRKNVIVMTGRGCETCQYARARIRLEMLDVRTVCERKRDEEEAEGREVQPGVEH